MPEAKGKARKGSHASTSQIAWSVRDGKAVTAFLNGHEPIRGWVAGMDDYHWIVVDEEGHTTLVHKSAPAMQIESSPSIESAPQAVQDRVSTFRDFLMREHFNHVEPS